MTLRDQLIRDEGVRLFPYEDTVGKLTIGCGRNLTDVGLSSQEVEVLLDNDIARVTAEVDAALPWAAAMGEARYGVLLNMAFNLGIAGLLRFERALTAMESGEWNTAALEMLDSRWAYQVGDRARRLADQMLTGEWV